jgi:hypothetical protein
MQESLLSEMKFQLHLILDKLEWCNNNHHIKYNSNYELECSKLIQNFRLKCNSYFLEHPQEFKSICIEDHTFRIKVYNTLQHESIDLIVFNEYRDRRIIDIADNETLTWIGYFTCSID